MNVLVARQDGAEHDPRCRTGTAGGPRQRRQGEAVEPLPQACHQPGIDRVAQPVGGVEERHVPGLVGDDAPVLDHAGIVLQRAVGDHHVANVELGVEPARDPGEDDQPAAEPVGQQGRDHGRVDLADSGPDQHDRVPIEMPLLE